MTPQERANKAAEAMWSGDAASQWIGMTLVRVDEGCAELSLIVRPHHANGHGICHGGVIFSLADSAFAFACNSRNQSSVAQHNMISYIAPSHVGDTLIASASEVSLSGRSGLYDVQVRNQDGLQIAEMRGASRMVRGQLFDETQVETP